MRCLLSDMTSLISPSAAEAEVVRIAEELKKRPRCERRRILLAICRDRITRSSRLVADPIDRYIDSSADAQAVRKQLVAEFWTRFCPEVCNNLQRIGWPGMTPAKLEAIFRAMERMFNKKTVPDEISLDRADVLSQSQCLCIMKDLIEAVNLAITEGALASMMDRRTREYRELKQHLPELVIMLRNAVQSSFLPMT